MKNLFLVVAVLALVGTVLTGCKKAENEPPKAPDVAPTNAPAAP